MRCLRVTPLQEKIQTPTLLFLALCPWKPGAGGEDEETNEPLLGAAVALGLKGRGLRTEEERARSWRSGGQRPKRPQAYRTERLAPFPGKEVGPWGVHGGAATTRGLEQGSLGGGAKMLARAEKTGCAGGRG